MNEELSALVIDDEKAVRFFLEETLRTAGYSVASASSGQEALDRLRTEGYDVVLLDLMLGGRIDGLRILQAIRWQYPETTVIILTAHGSLETAMAAIREGVDDYLLKPVEPEDVRTAISAALQRRRRAQSSAEEQDGSILRGGPFIIDLDKHSVEQDGEPVELTVQEFNLLVHLVRNADRVVPPGELVEVVRHYKPAYANEAREIIKWYVHRLRRRIEPDPSEPRYVLNVRGVGYTFGE